MKGQRLLRSGADWKPLASGDDRGHDFISRDKKFRQINVQAIECHQNSLRKIEPFSEVCNKYHLKKG